MKKLMALSLAIMLVISLCSCIGGIAKSGIGIVGGGKDDLAKKYDAIIEKWDTKVIPIIESNIKLSADKQLEIDGWSASLKEFEDKIKNQQLSIVESGIISAALDTIDIALARFIKEMTPK